MTRPAGAAVREEHDSPGTGDLISGLCAAGFGIALLLHVRGFPQMPDGAPGPALFPGILGALFILFGSILVVRWYRHRAVPSTEAAAGEIDRPGSGLVDVVRTDEPGDALGGPSIAVSTAWVNALSVVGTVVAYVLLAGVLGFALTMSLLLFLLTWRLGTPLLVALITSGVTTGLLYVLFERVLFVPLPTGIFG